MLLADRRKKLKFHFQTSTKKVTPNKSRWSKIVVACRQRSYCDACIPHKYIYINICVYIHIRLPRPCSLSLLLLFSPSSCAHTRLSARKNDGPNWWASLSRNAVVVVCYTTSQHETQQSFTINPGFFSPLPSLTGYAKGFRVSRYISLATRNITRLCTMYTRAYILVTRWWLNGKTKTIRN